MATKFKLIDAHHPQNEPFWDIRMLKKLLSHNCDYTCATSPRSVGKSFSAMTLAKECIDRGENVVWERYNKVELGLALSTWTDFAPFLKKEAIPNGVGWKLIDESSGGHVALIPWNIPQNAKGLDSAYIWEIKDEFIPESYKQKTRIFTEFDDAMSVRKSIIRKYPTRSIYLANAIQWINPYTTNWGLPPVDVGYALKAIQDFSYTSRSGKTFKDSRNPLGRRRRTLRGGTPSLLRQRDEAGVFEDRGMSGQVRPTGTAPDHERRLLHGIPSV